MGNRCNTKTTASATWEVAFVTIINVGCFLQRSLLSVSGGVAATEPLRRGLNELSDVCQHVLNTFQVSLLYPADPPCGKQITNLSLRKQQCSDIDFCASFQFIQKSMNLSL